MSDEELYRRWVGGSRAAGGELVDRHWASLYRWIEAQGAHDAADVSQETWLRAQSGGFRGSGSFSGWLRAIARSVILRRARERDATLDLASSTSPSRRILRRQAADAIDRLPDPFRVTARMVWLEQRQAREVAATMGAPEKTVRSRLRIAREKLQEMLT